MKFVRFIIDKYRAVGYTEVTIGNNLIPIIGINESGKTSILKAILAFDKNKDNYNKGEHLNYKNRYIIGADSCVIKAEIIIDKESDVAEIGRRMRLRVGDELDDTLKHYYKEAIPFIIARCIETKKYFVEGIPISETQNERLANIIYDLLPYILYFDDFSDRVPESITFPKNYIEPDYRIRKSKEAEWQELLEEIFNRATNQDYTLKSFLQMEDGDDQYSLLSDVGDTLNSEIIEDWKRLKQKGSTLADDEGDLELKINYISPTGSGDFVFEFKVIDKSHGNRERRFNINERSKGFQWFFNFFVKLKFNAKYKIHPSGAIYLLDEPGSYLHSSAQEELLKNLKDISELNTIIYCTHSQYLLNPEIINIASVKIASKDNGTVTLKNFGSSGTSNFQGALSPVYDALHLKTGIVGTNYKKVIITEGVTDYYLLSLIKKFTGHILDKDIQIIPGSGAGQLKELISFSIAWTEKYLVLLDSDKAGRDAYKKYTSYFGDIEQNNIWKYKIPTTDTDVLLENFFSDSDAEKLLRLTGASDLKSGIISLFYLDETSRKDFVLGLDINTLENMNELFDKINRHFQ